jgi:hypothetical protein
MNTRGSVLDAYVALVAPVEVAHVGDIDLECALYFLKGEMSDIVHVLGEQSRTST